MGNEMDTSHIPPGYNHKILALDVDGKVQMIMIDGQYLLGLCTYLIRVNKV